MAKFGPLGETKNSSWFKRHEEDKMKKVIIAWACFAMVIFCLSLQPEAQETKDSFKLLQMRQQGLWGYMDRTGKTVIAPEFVKATPFSGDLAMVFEPFDQNLSIPFYIDRTGRTVWYPKIDSWLIPEQLEALIEIEYTLDPPGEGLALAYELEPLGYKLGYIDQTGKYVIQPQFSKARPFSEGVAAVCIRGAQQRCGYINKNGKVIIKPQFEVAHSFSEGLAAVRIDGKYGYINKDGRIVVNPKFEDAGSFSEGLAAVRLNNKWSYIDKTGKLIINAQFDKAGVFSEGLATIAVQDPGRKPVLPDSMLMGINFRGKWGYIDMMGKMLISPEFDDVSGFSEGLGAVKIAGKWGYIDKNGKMSIKPQFDYAHHFSGGLALVWFGKKMAYIEKNGKVVWGPSD